MLTLGQPQGVDRSPTCPGFSADKNGRRGSREVTVARLDAVGGHAARALVRLRRGRRGRARHQRPRRDDAARRAAGPGPGRLGPARRPPGRRRRRQLAGGARQRPRPDPARPCPTGQERVSRPGGARHPSPARPSRSRPPARRRSWSRSSRGSRSAAARSLSVAGDLPLVVRGRYGFGRVTLIGARRRPEAVRRLGRPRASSGSRRSTCAGRPADEPAATGRIGGRRAVLPVGRHRPRRASSASPWSSSRA